MKITTEKQELVKLYDWLKTKKTTLKELINKKNFKSYSELIDYCNKLYMTPCSAHDFEKSFNELYQPPQPKKEPEIEFHHIDEVELNKESELEEIEKEKNEVNQVQQKQTKKKV